MSFQRIFAHSLFLETQDKNIENREFFRTVPTTGMTVFCFFPVLIECNDKS